MPTGTKRGYALILASTTLVAITAALAICWAAGAFDGTLALAGWVAIAVLLGLGWICGGMLVSFLFLGAGIERNATPAEVVAARHQTRPRRRGGLPPQGSG
jgi:hypothetical protein